MRIEGKHGLNVVLRNPSLEFLQSTRAVDLEGYAAPNLEYQLAGLTGYGNGENWRFLHQIFFKLADRVPEQSFLEATAEKLVYKYACGGSTLVASYELDANRLLVSFQTEKKCDALLHAKIFADIRHMYATSEPEKHAIEKKDCGLVVSKEGRRLGVACKNAVHVSTTRERLKWWFPAENEEREVLEAGELTCALPCVISVECSPTDVRVPPRLSLSKIRLRKAFAENGFARERVKALSTFSLNGFPEAGGLWFRNNWFRDSFEGLLNNYGFYEKACPSITTNALKAARATLKNGLVANKLPEHAGEKPSYNALDSTLLYYLLCLRKGVFSLREFKQTLSRFKQKDSEVFLDGLLYSPANYSWTDELVDIAGIRFPTRLPKDWLSKVSEPCALLEINALWQRLLLEARQYDLASQHAAEFKKHFIPNFPHVRGLKKEAREFHSAKIVALALLDFPRSFVKKQFELAKPFLAFKNKKLFGVAVNPSSEWQYQGKSVWPRDTPYLLRVLGKLGLQKEQRELLESSLEPGSCLFYAQECYSFPDLKPLKNPIQYWSHYVQPFVTA